VAAVFELEPWQRRLLQAGLDGPLQVGHLERAIVTNIEERRRAFLEEQVIQDVANLLRIPGRGASVFRAQGRPPFNLFSQGTTSLHYRELVPLPMGDRALALPVCP
jgi:hypothetical protein